MPRESLGMVTMLPEGDRTSQSLQADACNDGCVHGSRVAEELIMEKMEPSGTMSGISCD
jgi:ATP-dependent Zn protease